MEKKKKTQNKVSRKKEYIAYAVLGAFAVVVIAVIVIVFASSSGAITLPCCQ